MARKNSKTVYVFAFLLLLGGLGYLVASGLSEGATPTLQVGQALTMDAGDLLKVRIYGKVWPEGIENHEDGLGVSFMVADQLDPAQHMKVYFHGAVPDTFKEGAEVILKGSYDATETVFRASQMTTKCPSKYEEKRVEG